MDAPPLAQPTPFTLPAASASRTLAAWLVNALATPALLEDRGEVVSAGPRVWAAWAFQACRGALSEVLSRPVSIEPGGSPGTVVFSAELRGAGAGDPTIATIGLDRSAARTIADALGVTLAGIRGAGPITAGEAGLVEFAALEVLDRMLASGFEASPAVLGLVRVGEEAAIGTRESRGARIPLRIVVAGRAGGAVVVLHGATEAIPPMGPLGAGIAAGFTPVSLSLPAFALATEELATLAVGDVVLPGLNGLSEATGCCLITPTMWRLCGATMTSDSATHLAIAAGPLDIRPETIPGSVPEGHVPAWIHVGEARVSHEELHAWGAGRAVSLGKPPGREATLMVGCRPRARGELVRAEGSLGLRVAWIGAETEDET